MLSTEFLPIFKRTTEARWSTVVPDPHIYGFQFQQGTRWNPGLSDEQVAAFESAIGCRVPDDFRDFLRVMNGTDLPMINTYGNSGHPHQESTGVYSYPRDLQLVRLLMEETWQIKHALMRTLADQGFSLCTADELVPLFVHRYIISGSDPRTSVVLSIASAADAIVYGDSLKTYLEKEFLQE